MEPLHKILSAIADLKSEIEHMLEDPFYFVFCKACADNYHHYNWEYPYYVSTFVDAKDCPMCPIEKKMIELQASLKSENVQQQLKVLLDKGEYNVCDKKT